MSQFPIPDFGFSTALRQLVIVKSWCWLLDSSLQSLPPHGSELQSLHLLACNTSLPVADESCHSTCVTRVLPILCWFVICGVFHSRSAYGVSILLATTVVKEMLIGTPPGWTFQISFKSRHIQNFHPGRVLFGQKSPTLILDTTYKIEAPVSACSWLTLQQLVPYHPAKQNRQLLTAVSSAKRQRKSNAGVAICGFLLCLWPRQTRKR